MKNKNKILYIIIFGIFIFTSFFVIKIPNDKLYNIYYTPYTINNMFRSSSAIDDSIYYNESILQQIISNNENNKMSHFYLGQLYQKNKNYKKAIEQYNWLINDNDNIFIEQSQWNIGLCYLKTNKNAEAIKYFEKLSEYDGYYKSKAESIINFKIHVFIEIIFSILIVIFIIYIYYKQTIHEKTSKQMIDFLTKNVDLLNDFYQKIEIEEIKKTIQLYSQLQIISKVSNCDYISYFKYNYMENKISINFMFTLDKNSILEDTLLYDLGNNISVDTLKFSSDDLNFISINDVKNINIYKSMKYKGTNKIYYKNIFKNTDNPVGFVAISYKDINYIIPKGDKIEIIRMIEKIKSYV